MATEFGGPELKMDPASLYREDTYTDRKIGTIRVLTPVTAAGATDPGRKILYVGETQLLTTGGLLPLVFEIEATNLTEAVSKFADGAEAAIERTRREIEQMRREAASQIIVPDRMPGGLGGPGGPPGGGLIRPR
ncbi:MAG TPA: hypothetical protein VGQ77_13710 [Methylomirabilota bacterium]|jgi:hypothetical protein|nr:hypothetical protein [Methylomirabilota bacterium]